MLLSLIVDRFEEDKAVLKTEDKEEIIWPKKKLPENIKEGSAMVAFLTDDKMKDEKSLNLAKEVLNEILNPEE